MTPLRVLHVIPSVALEEGGPSRAMALIEQGLSQAGVAVTTLTTDFGQGRQDSAHGHGASHTRIHCPLWSTHYKIAPAMAGYLRAHVRSFDVVHIHALFSFAPTVAAWACRAYGVPYVVRPLGTLAEYGLAMRRQRLKRLSLRYVESANLRHAAAVHFTARRELEEAEQLGIPFRGVVIPVGVAPGSAPAGDLRADFPQLGNRRIVLFLSRLDPKKNLEALIDAVHGSKQLTQSAAIVVAGSGEAAYVAELKRRVSRLGQDGSFLWLGHVDGARKASALAAADVFCLPSHSENFGIAAVEAMLAGLPCVLGEGVAISGDVQSAGAGLAVPPTAGGVASGLERMLADAAATRRMGEAARELAEAKFSVAGMSRNLIDLYQRVRLRSRGEITAKAAAGMSSSAARDV